MNRLGPGIRPEESSAVSLIAFLHRGLRIRLGLGGIARVWCWVFNRRAVRGRSVVQAGSEARVYKMRRRVRAVSAIAVGTYKAVWGSREGADLGLGEPRDVWPAGDKRGRLGTSQYVPRCELVALC